MVEKPKTLFQEQNEIYDAIDRLCEEQIVKMNSIIANLEKELKEPKAEVLGG
mgnify:CR=1 FL=1